MGPQTSAPAAKLATPALQAPAGAPHAQGVSESESKGAFANEDHDALALEDYDVAANFDLLSELPKGESRVGN